LRIENAKMRQKNQLPLTERLLAFSIQIVRLSNRLPKSQAGYAIASQIVKSGTSVGANCEEAQDAMSTKDFLRTLTISLKEAKETRYWLKVILGSELVSEVDIKPVLDECNQIIAILITSVKTLKVKVKNV
jgi:four helix bundle protein